MGLFFCISFDTEKLKVSRIETNAYMVYIASKLEYESDDSEKCHQYCVERQSIYTRNSTVHMT